MYKMLLDLNRTLHKCITLQFILWKCDPYWLILHNQQLCYIVIYYYSLHIQNILYRNILIYAAIQIPSRSKLRGLIYSVETIWILHIFLVKKYRKIILLRGASHKLITYTNMSYIFYNPLQREYLILLCVWLTKTTVYI